jgi:CubicO group peptidase (beta-lactamase class C family)
VRRILLLSIAFACVNAFAQQPLPAGAPDKAGFSKEGLERIDRFFEREIAAKRVPGAVVAVAREGKLVYFKSFGVIDPAGGAPMPKDAIFQLASMTKPMTAVGGLVLMEQGRLPLHSRLEEYFPGFANGKVGIVGANGEIATEPVKRPIYLHDLYRHTSGIAYGGRGTTPVHKLWPPSSAGASATYTGEEFIEKIAPLPLLHQPGTIWDYSLAVDVLGLVEEKVSGKRLDDHLKDVIWDKLGMADTTFNVPEEKRKRIAHPFDNDPLTGKPQSISALKRPAKFDCGGGCAFGTVGDYLRFGQMLLNGGALDGQRVLSPMTVRLMTSDHLGTTIKNNVAGIEGHRDGYGFGLTVAVRLKDGMASVPGSPGDFTWNGANGTGFWVDPAERLVVVFGTAAPGDLRKYYREQMSDLVYGAMTRMHH